MHTSSKTYAKASTFTTWAVQENPPNFSVQVSKNMASCIIYLFRLVPMFIVLCYSLIHLHFAPTIPCHAPHATTGHKDHHPLELRCQYRLE